MPRVSERQKKSDRMVEVMEKLVDMGQRYFQPPQLPDGVEVTQFTPPPRVTEPASFEETQADGGVILYDWPSLLAGATHGRKYPDGALRLYRYEETLITLRGEAAERLAAFAQQVKARNEAMHVVPMGRMY